jgi:hypothetical protein
MNGALHRHPPSGAKKYLRATGATDAAAVISTSVRRKERLFTQHPRNLRVCFGFLDCELEIILDRIVNGLYLW